MENRLENAENFSIIFMIDVENSGKQRRKKRFSRLLKFIERVEQEIFHFQKINTIEKLFSASKIVFFTRRPSGERENS